MQDRQRVPKNALNVFFNSAQQGGNAAKRLKVWTTIGGICRSVIGWCLNFKAQKSRLRQVSQSFWSRYLVSWLYRRKRY